MSKFDIFDYIATYNIQDPETLEQRAVAQLESEELEFEIQAKKLNRTFAVDEDNLARFIELVSMIQAGITWFKNNNARIQEIDKRLEAAKTGNFISRNQWDSLIEEKMVRFAKASSFSPRYQAAKAEQQEIIKREGMAIWAKWHQIQDPEEHLKDYLEAPLLDFFDPENIDNQSELHNQDLGDGLSLAHMHEMEELEALDYVDYRVIDPNPYLGLGWWDSKYERKLKTKRW